jgi:DNA-binding GntR family transcriptional regulator
MLPLLGLIGLYATPPAYRSRTRRLSARARGVPRMTGLPHYKQDSMKVGKMVYNHAVTLVAPAGVAAALRDAIVQGDLSPGDQIRQTEWAERLGTSRIPVREALESLAAEGLFAHDHNRGYVVVRIDPDDMAQIYLMRCLLEAELLRSVADPDPAALAELRRARDAAAQAKMGEDFELWNQLEPDFHTLPYQMSPMNLVRAEFERLWLLSNIYRRLNHAVALPLDARSVTYYGQMVDALAAGDRDRLVKLMTHLREISQRGCTRLLQRRHA